MENSEPKPVVKPQRISESARADFKIYKSRFWMLFLFCMLSLLCSMMYPLYTGIASVTKCYYNVSQEAVNWTGLMMSVVYVIFFFPVSIFINKIGLRKTVLCISLLNTIASACQFATLKPSGFTYAMVSMFFAYLSSVFIFALPPLIAAVWFPSNEVSRACASGILGNQLGGVCGFLLTPFMVFSDCSRKDLIENGKFNVACILTALNTGMLVLTALTFQNEPLNPPSECQALKVKSPSIPYKISALRVIRNKHFILLLFLYGLFVATFIALATLLNEIVIHYFPDGQKDVGVMGAILIGSGIIGCAVAGYILDLTHKFKETSMGICISAFLSYMCFSGLLLINIIWIQFIAIGVFGFFLMSYICVGFEYGIELTYPDLEVISASLLTFSSMVFGIALTEISSFVMINVSVLASNGVLCIGLFFCCILSSFMTTEYKRSKKNASETVAAA